MFQDVSPISNHLRLSKKSQQFEGLHLCDTISHPWVAIFIFIPTNCAIFELIWWDYFIYFPQNKGPDPIRPQLIRRKSGFQRSNKTLSSKSVHNIWCKLEDSLRQFWSPFSLFELSHRIKKSPIWSWPLPRPHPIFMEIYPMPPSALKQGHDFADGIGKWAPENFPISNLEPWPPGQNPTSWKGSIKITKKALFRSFSLVKWKKIRSY